jgi:integrase/recombinase XerD
MDDIRLNMSNEVMLKIINEITKVITYFNVETQEQIKLRNSIEAILNDYDITSKCTALTKGDIIEKAYIYLASKKLEGMKDTTRYNYTLLFKKLNNFFNKPINTFSTADLRIFLAKEYSNNQPNSLNDKINKIRAFFGWLQDEGYIITDPSKNLKPTKVPYRKRNPISEVEMVLLKESCSKLRDKTLLEVISSTGIRVSEASNALVSKINWIDNSITVIGKGDKERTVYFSTRAGLLIKQYLEDRQSKGIISDYLFVAGKYPYEKLGSRSIEKDIKQIAANANVEGNIIPHRFRTSYICKCVRQGISLPAIQKLVGHVSSNTTEKYLTINDDFLKQEYRKIAL